MDLFLSELNRRIKNSRKLKNVITKNSAGYHVPYSSVIKKLREKYHTYFDSDLYYDNYKKIKAATN